MAVTPKVSVIVPVYNNARYLHQALDSVVNQTLKEIEIIIVNDGSTDASLDIINEYASKDLRIKVINQPNRGVANAINNGMARATSEYLAEMDSDDYIKPEMYEELYEYSKTNDLDIVISNYYEFVGNHENIKTKLCRFFDTPNWYYKNLYPSDFYINKLSEDYLRGFGWCIIWSALYKKSFLIENKICWNEDVRAYNDNGFWFQTRALAKKIMYVDKAYYFYRRDNSSSTINNFEKFEEDFFGEQIFIKNFLKERNLWNDLKDLYIKQTFLDYLYFALPKLPDNKINQFFLKISGILSEFINQHGDMTRNIFNEYEWSTLNMIVNDPLKAVRKYRIERIYRRT